MSAENPNWKEFINLCRQAEDKEQLTELFDFLFSPEEKQTLTTRILLANVLLKGEKTQREIAKELNVSIAKITRGSNSLKRISDSLKSFLMKEIV